MWCTCCRAGGSCAPAARNWRWSSRRRATRNTRTRRRDADRRMAELKVIKTAAEQGRAEAFAGARAQLPGAAAVKSLRESAFRTFEARGLPHRRVEEWKYTDLRALMRDAKPLAAPPDAATKLKA